MEMVEMEMEMVRRRKIGNGNGFRFLEQKCILRAKFYFFVSFFRQKRSGAMRYVVFDGFGYLWRTFIFRPYPHPHPLDPSLRGL